MQPPEPSPAPTLDSHFPGFYRSDTRSTVATLDSSYAQPHSSDDTVTIDDHTHSQSTLEQAEEVLADTGKALYGAAATVAGGLLGSLGLAASSSTQEEDGAATPKATASSLLPTEDEVDETHRSEFGEQAIEKENHALEESPAQKLISSDQEEGAHLTGAGALGGALLAGAAGAKVEENEVRSPTSEDNELERKGGVEANNVAVPPAPDFGAPSIEKEQAALAVSPAQQLLRSDTSSSSVTQAETALLAGAAGAKLANKEVEEPSKAPLDKVAEKSAEVGAPLGLASPNETEAHAVPLEREVRRLFIYPLSPPRTGLTFSTLPPSFSALPLPHSPSTSSPFKPQISQPPSPSALHDTSLSLQRPDLAQSQRPTNSSFAAAVLAAAEGVHTPTETGAGSYGGFGIGGREIKASDHEEGGNAREVLNTSSATGPSSLGEPEQDEVVHNPAPLVPAALAGTAAGASLLGPESAASAEKEPVQPQDFEPYSAPVVEQSPEAKIAAATPLPDTPGLESAPSKSFAPAILGSGGVYPNSPLTHNNDDALGSTDTIPATVNAQNYVAPAAAAGVGAVAAHELVDRDGAKSPEEKIPLREALDEGPNSAKGGVPAPVAATTTTGETQTVPVVAATPGVEEVELEGGKKDKGKGKEMVEDVALLGAGTGTGVLAGETLRREDGPTAPTGSIPFSDPDAATTTAAPALTSQPTSSTIDSILPRDDPALGTNPLDAQRAFPPIPHFNRDAALNSTDEPIIDPSVDGTSSSSTPKVLDPKALAASSPATSPEQAGFTNVPKDGALTGAMQDFAHLSQPSSIAEEKAVAEAETLPAVAGVGAVVEPVETVEKREYEEGTGHGGLPLAAGAAGTGLAAGAVGGAVLSHDYAGSSAPTPLSSTSTAPPVPHVAADQALPAGAVATPLVAATAAQQPASQVVQPVATPVSRFTEQTHATPTRTNVSGYDTPSSTRAVKGTPAASTTPNSSVHTATAGSSPASGSSDLPAVAAAAGVSPSELANVALVDAGVIERSKHMKIQTTRDEEGHKRLHRKSLSGSQFAPSNRRASLSKTVTPVAPAQQQEQYYAATQPMTQREVQVAPSGVTGADGAVLTSGRPGLPTIPSEREAVRRDRMLNDIVGVRDPTYAAVPSTSSYQPRLSESSSNSASTASTHTPLAPMRASTPPVASSAFATTPQHHPDGTIIAPHHTGSVVASPSGAGVQRKLSKRRPSNAEGEIKKEGFLSRLLHGGGNGGGHQRQSSVGSNHSATGSPRTSIEQSRM
ncbi:hypothetical protein JCM11251_007430 [Rhodosporidiobolus azoricus]